MLDTEDPIRHEKVKIMNEIKKEWLIDRAEYMLAEIEDEITHLQAQIEKDTIAVNRMEDKFSDSEEDFYIAAIDSGLDEIEATSQRLIQEYRGNVTRNTPVISEAAKEYQKQLRHYLQTRVKNF